MNTENKRAGAVCISLPWRALYPRPDDQIVADDRAQAVAMYPKFTGLISSTARLHLPVDCVMAGDQHRVNKGRVRGRGLSHAFGE